MNKSFFNQQKQLDNGGPAFPQENDSTGSAGMTLRDYFAGQALAAMLSNPEKDPAKRGSGGIKSFPRHAYDWADAMIEARKT